MTKENILIVDDDENLREILQFNMENDGFVVDVAVSGEEALEKITPQHKLVLLDVMMDGISGFEVAKRLRAAGNKVPIIFLTAKDTETDLLRGFAVGGDDYITKPFSLQEVMARVKAVLARTNAVRKGEEIEEGDLRVDIVRRLVYLRGELISLSRTEFDILKLLIQNPAHIYPREEILEQVWKGETVVLPRTVDVHISRLRSRLKDYGIHIVNRQSFGYCWQ